MKAVGYTRVSTEEQAQHGYSLDAQVAIIEKTCKEKGWELVEIYTDEGFSAKPLAELDRPGLLKMMDDAKTKAVEFDIVLFTALDRLTRDGKDYQNIRFWFLDCGVRIGETSNPDIDLNDPFVKFTMDIKAAVAELERRMIGVRTKRGMDEAAKQGFHMGRPPVGYEIKEGKLVRNALGEKAFALYRMNERIKPAQLQRELTIDYKTAWNLLNGLRDNDSKNP